MYIPIDFIGGGAARWLPGKDVHELEAMKQMGLSVLAISEVTGYDRKVGRQNGTLARRF